MDDWQYQGIDNQILQTIDAERAEHHACTVGNLASRMRMAKSTVALRVVGLRERGLVTWSDNYAGSLRRIQTVESRLYELTIVDAVEQQADAADGTGGMPSDEWCRQLLARAGSPDLPAPARTGDEPPEGEEPVTPAPAAAAMAATGEETVGEWYCAPCSKPFKTRVAMEGHTRASKAHLEKVTELARAGLPTQ